MTVVRGCPFPDDRYYHPGYNVWLKPGSDDLVAVGATAYGVALAGAFFAFIPKPAGSRVEAGRAFGLLEIAKTVTSVRTPLSATLVRANEAAMADPDLINRDPYGAGWLVQLRVDAWDECRAGLVSGSDLESAFEAEMTRDGFEGAIRP